MLRNNKENIILDNLEYISNEKILYSIFNFVEQYNKYLIINSNKPINSINFELPDLKSRLNKLISKTGPVFIEVLIDPNQTISPKLEFGRPIEDVSPLINRSIFDKLMISNRKIKKANR